MESPGLIARERSTYVCLAGFVVVLWLATLSLRPLFNTDEGRYAEIPREMLAGGDWVIPHLNGLAYIEKPPLQYWATALSLKLFGLSEFAARLYTALSALITVLAVWVAARRLWDSAAAWRAAAMLASMLLFLVMGQLLTLDMSLTLYSTLALLGFALANAPATSADASRTAERGWMLLAWAAAALGVLTKGLVAALIPGTVLVLYSAMFRDFSPWRRLHAALGLPLFLAITVPWHWLAAQRLPDFLQFFFVHEHFARYLTPSADREEAWWFFGAVFLLGSAPWTVAALRVVVTGWQGAENASNGWNLRRFLWLWIGFVCVFFSVSDSKLVPYILPALPPLALMMATLPETALKRDLQWTAILTLGAAVALGLLCFLAPRYVAASDRSAFFLALAKPMSEVAALLGASGLYVLSQRRRGVTRAAVFLGVGWCLAGLLTMRAAAIVGPVYSGIALVRALPAVPAGTPLYSVATYDQTLPFYWQRTVTLVAYRGELDYGLNKDPAAEIVEIAQFLERWNHESQAYAVMEMKMFDELSLRAVPMVEIARDAKRVLVARR
jgi:4-amino-4-deoxy-L-arabinose transferase-like glycosyltransferase